MERIGDQTQTADELAANPYLRAVCQEALRVMPVIPVVSRKVREPVVIGGYPIEAGAHVMPCIYLTHHRPDVYGDPERFRPERFFERRFSPYEYLPFGGGQRTCIGNAFALHEMTVVLGTLLSRNNSMMRAATCSGRASDTGSASGNACWCITVSISPGSTDSTLTLRSASSAAHKRDR